jgi:hypothetical protein
MRRMTRGKNGEAIKEKDTYIVRRRARASEKVRPAKATSIAGGSWGVVP